jgi:hypothetical protein
MAVNVQETLPTGKYDNLGDAIVNGFGAGTYTTTLALYTQTYAWLPTGRILRLRFNASEAWSNSARLEGASVYGTRNGFQGRVKPGAVTFGDLAAEYSLSQHWVAAMDLADRYSGPTWLRPATGKATAQNASYAIILAPAIEYNFSARMGVLLGTRVIEAGHNFARSITPVIANDLVY